MGRTERMAGFSQLEESGNDSAPTANSTFVIILCLFASIGGVLFGYDTGINGGVQVCESFLADLCEGTYDHDGKDCSSDNITEQPDEWIEQKAYFVALLSVGAMVGSMLGGYVADKLGRRWTIAIGCIMFTLATFFTISMSSMPPILFGRFMLGVPVGMLSFVVPMYAAEVAPKELRGTLGSLMQLAIVTGILLATVVAVPIQTGASGWRIALGLCAVPGIILLVGIFGFPESPRWLCKFKSADAASAALRRLRGTDDVSTEVNEISSALEADEGNEGSWKDLLAPGIKERVLVAVGLQILQQATGVNSIFYYAPTIFADIGVENPLAAGLVCGLANLGGTLLGIKMIDRKGRRTLLMAGAIGMSIGMITASLIKYTVDVKVYPQAGYIIILAICFFVVNFAFSWGPICWLYPSEIFPMGVRAKAVSLATLANWIMNVLVAERVPGLLTVLSAEGLFMVFGICGLGCFAFVYYFVPETKGKSLEEIDQMWSKNAAVISPRGRQEDKEDLEHSGL